MRYRLGFKKITPEELEERVEILETNIEEVKRTLMS